MFRNEPFMNIKYLFSWVRVLKAYNERFRKIRTTILWDRGGFESDSRNSTVSPLNNNPNNAINNQVFI